MAFRFRLPWAGAGVKKSKNAEEPRAGEGVPEELAQGNVAVATEAESASVNGAPSDGTAGVAHGPADEAALKEFLLKNFLYEGPADKPATPPMQPLAPGMPETLVVLEPLRITVPDRLPASMDQPHAISGQQEILAPSQRVHGVISNADAEVTIGAATVSEKAATTVLAPPEESVVARMANGSAIAPSPATESDTTNAAETASDDNEPDAKLGAAIEELRAIVETSLPASTPDAEFAITASDVPQPRVAAPAEQSALSPEEPIAAVFTIAAKGDIAAPDAVTEILAAASDVPVEPEAPPPKPSDWAFEEKLASHKEWVESQGVTGKRADLSCAHLEEAELISVNLRYADFHAANLKAADLLLTDLRDACLVRANLEESCLVGANLEGANLEGARMESAMGLVPRQLAGATLRDAVLPATIRQFSALEEFERVSRVAKNYFSVAFAVSAVSWLMIWKTKDVQLLTNSAIIPFLHSAAAATALPTDAIYLIAPAVLFLLYLVLQYHLQRLWDAVLELPAVFPDGRTLGDKSPRIITGLLRAHFRWMNQDAPSTRVIERVMAVLLAYWVVPATLALYWARYLTVQQFHDSFLHVLVTTLAIGVAVHATTKVGRQQERWILHGKGAGRIVARIRRINPISVAACAFVALTVLSAGTIKGVPHDRSRAPQYSASSIRRWAPTAFWSVGFNPFADLTEASISQRPAGWTGADDQVASVTGAYLNNRHIRYAQAYGVFLANSHLWQADFQGSFLSEADLRNADLGQASLRLATLDRASMSHANLDRAVLDGANLTRVDLHDANLSYSSAVGSVLVDARLDGASLYSARLDSASMIRASLEKADVRNAYLGNADLSHADLQQAYFWSAQLPGAHLDNARLGSAIFIEANLSHTDLRGAQMAGTVLNGADLTGTNLDGTDLRGSLGLTASQVCSAASRRGALLDDTLGTAVDAQCGGVH
jgi:uncharacterized protein YjbI with pentapeptide repeats